MAIQRNKTTAITDKKTKEKGIKEKKKKKRKWVQPVIEEASSKGRAIAFPLGHLEHTVKTYENIL